jgi:hypothetical protein
MGLGECTRRALAPAHLQVDRGGLVAAEVLHGDVDGQRAAAGGAPRADVESVHKEAGGPHCGLGRALLLLGGDAGGASGRPFYDCRGNRRGAWVPKQGSEAGVYSGW